MNWKKFIIPPVAIYAVVFLFISALIGAKIDAEATWVWVVTLVIIIIGLYFASNYANSGNWREGILYGIVWLVILIILDLILTLPFTGSDYFRDWRSYLPYVLTLIIPTVLYNKNASV